jgi:hypothetical protein
MRILTEKLTTQLIDLLCRYSDGYYITEMRFARPKILSVLACEGILRKVQVSARVTTFLMGYNFYYGFRFLLRGCSFHRGLDAFITGL